MKYLVAGLMLIAAPALAEVPRVVADIPPVHALVARVMAGVGVPDLILPPGVSPHDAALRPSDAQRLAAADLVVWVGPELSPAITRSIDALASGAVLGLLDVPETVVLGFREGAVFGAAEDTHAHGHGAGHGEEHAEEQAEEHDQAHSGRDPHAWLDPVNATVWLGAIANALGAIDPENSACYAENARASATEIEALSARIDARMAPLQGRPFIVFHDAYHYFEARYGIEAAGSIAVGDGVSPGPGRLVEIGAAVTELGVVCVFAEPQFNAGYTEAVLSDSGARIGVIDPLGAALEPGEGLYLALLDGMATAFETCLAE